MRTLEFPIQRPDNALYTVTVQGVRVHQRGIIDRVQTEWRPDGWYRVEVYYRDRRVEIGVFWTDRERTRVLWERWRPENSGGVPLSWWGELEHRESEETEAQTHVQPVPPIQAKRQGAKLRIRADTSGVHGLHECLEFKKSDRVVFGRPNGQKTLGRVLWSGKKVAIEQLEDREEVAVGERWKVHPDLVRAATEEERGREIGPKVEERVPTIVEDGRRPIVSIVDRYAFGRVR